MSATALSGSDSRVARHLGLKVPTYHSLRNLLDAGEYPVFLRCAAPAFARTFESPFGFEVLLERIRHAEAIERRRANLVRALEGVELDEELSALLKDTMNEAVLEDLSLLGSPSAAPADFVAPEREPLIEFLAALRGDVRLALKLTDAFEKDGVISITANPKANPEKSERYKDLLGDAILLSEFDISTYLHLRRAERAHEVIVEFALPLSSVQKLFSECEGVPPQEKESYRPLFFDFVSNERVSRMVHHIRAHFKRQAEDIALQSGWEQVERTLDRGAQQGLVVGLTAITKDKAVIALANDKSDTPRTLEVQYKDDKFAETLKEFIGDNTVSLLAVQADSKSRSFSKHLSKALPGSKPRMVIMPMSVVKTMVREVARRPQEALLGHDARQAFLLAELAANPRAVAFHAPHIVRAFVPYRGEINPRILEEFENTFLRALLVNHGFDVNTANADVLKLVPGLNSKDFLAERSTGRFSSLQDVESRLAWTAQSFNAAACMMRVNGGENQLDARALHPRFYSVFNQALAQTDFSFKDLMKSPKLFDKLQFAELLSNDENAQGSITRIRNGVLRSKPKRLRFQGGSAKTNGGRKLETLRVGGMFKGVVKTVTEYGVFVAFGAEREGLVHVSQCATEYIKHPEEVLKVGQEVEVRLVAIDLSAKKIRLSMLTEEQEAQRALQKKERASGNSGGDKQGDRGGFKGGGRSGGGGDRGGKGGGKGGRGKGQSRDRNDYGPDPKKQKKEDIDPTNPFYQFFKQK
jgi:transcriptional accessory protein Tex/SPT6